MQKGFYPLEWFDNNNKFNHEGLPDREHVYSKLSQKQISEDDYKHACGVYDKLGCKTFYDYHMAYLNCDVLILADIFEHFRKTCINNYKLDPANYISAPALAWDSFLLTTGIEFDLISDPAIYDIIERQKRGGLCYVGS